MNYLLVFQTECLDKLVCLLGRDRVPFLARRNVAGPPDRTDASGLPFSVFLAIPHVPVLVEVASLERTFLESVEWSECHQAQPPVWTAAGQRAVAEAQAAAGDALPLDFSETELWPRRFVFPTSGNATLATEYVTRYMAGSLQNTASSRSDGNCVEVSRGEWSGPESSFDMEWVQQRSVAHGSMIAHWETHVQQMHGNLTQRSATNWDHYMDYQPGLLFEDCKL